VLPAGAWGPEQADHLETLPVARSNEMTLFVCRRTRNRRIVSVTTMSFDGDKVASVDAPSGERIADVDNRHAGVTEVGTYSVLPSFESFAEADGRQPSRGRRCGRRRVSRM